MYRANQRASVIFNHLRTNHRTPVIVSTSEVTSAGDKAFCAGGDGKALTDSGRVRGDLAKDFFKEEFTLNNAIGTLQVPWIALLNGITMGGGAGLSVHGMFRVATEKTLFAMPETSIGLFPAVGGGYFLPRLGGKLGIYLALTSYRLKGRQVQKAGIATHFVESSKLAALEKELLSLKGPQPHDIEIVLNKHQDESVMDKDTEFVLKSHMDQINRLFDGETVEEIMMNLEKDGSGWATKQLETLRKRSPTSLKVTLRQLREGANKSLQEVFVMEYRLSQRFMEDHDYYEGVRALLVDKDNAPKWRPDTLQGVTSEKVDWYFSQLPPNRELHL